MNETDNKQKKGGGMFSKIKAVSRRAATVAAGTVLVLSQCLGSFGAAFAPSTAYADTSTKTATVTLADTENGSLSFVGRNDDTKTITVNVGETVAIKASPADGYFANNSNIHALLPRKDNVPDFLVTKKNDDLPKNLRNTLEQYLQLLPPHQ